MLTITLIGIIAVFAVFASLQRVHINSLNAKTDRERAMHEVTKTQSQTQLKKATDERDHALKEAKNEYDLRRQAERNLQAANNDISVLKAVSEAYESQLRKYSRPRDPKTGRFYSAKAKLTKDNSVGLAAFDSMMGNAMEQLEGLTVRNLCDEVKRNADAGI